MTVSECEPNWTDWPMRLFGSPVAPNRFSTTVVAEHDDAVVVA